MTGHLSRWSQGLGLRRPSAGLLDEESGEGEFHEALEGPTVAFDPRAQQRAFVRVEQKSGELGRGQRFGHRTLLLRFRNGRLHVLGPALIEAAQALADNVALVGEFGAEITENAAALELGVGAERAESLIMQAQPLEGWV